VVALRAEGVDTVVYAGDPALGGRLAKQLHDGGVEVTFVGAWGADDERFLDLAGGAGQGALVVTTRSHPTWEPAAAGFTTAYRLAHHPAGPGPYAAEAYDAAGVLLRAVTAGEVTRAGVEGHVDNLQWTGITGPITFDDEGRRELTLRLAEVQGGRFVPAGAVP
jgi:branched-chain amino acid transport system substrate-binding protein